MKKMVLFTFVVLLSVNAFAQKKKTGKSAAVTSAFAKTDNLVAEVKSGNFQLTITDKGKPNDAIVIKTVDSKFVPGDCKLSAFTANGTKLYLLTWTEINQIKTDLKTEDITTVYSNIYEITGKKQVFSNTQMTNHITEKVFLDKLKNASETQEKIRREGFEFKLNPDGSIIQKGKTQENKFTYDPVKAEYVTAKKK
ncbi:hypothetical protein EZL74_05530 [Flavobacterium silvisoli]|uniref:Uncharacterized protein n=1 Tax=Flavobacterium silvisoli TaxID=2529433 RepID=A0A4Q9Z1J7_9FLAO|nr:hypothetical protein [Flavobacterium silvisoli]TBX70206.1 hypothetical protein EZL74_05530 [Flavobacterium silvisoli]